MPDLVGQTIGRYPIVARLGQGGMAEVFKAFHPGLGHYIAVKVMRSDVAADEDFLERFDREAKNVHHLRHQNIVRVLDFDTHQGMPYMAMDFVEGPTLKQELRARIKQGKPFSLEDVGRIMVALCEAIDYAHSQGMVHRDLKPSNFMLTQKGQILVLDFGIAKIADVTQLTMTGAVTGTPAYMSPEQGQGSRGDERSDIYSLGIVLYEMVTGRIPFDADTPLAVIFKHISDPLPLPRKINPNIPEAVELVILKALAKEPRDRFQSGAEFAAALREAFNLSPGDNLFRNPVFPVVSLPKIAELDPSDPTFTVASETPVLTRAESKGAAVTVVSDGRLPATRRLGLIAAGVGALVVIAVLVGVLVSGSTRSRNATATAESQALAGGRATQTGEAAQTQTAQALAQLPTATPTVTPLPTQTSTPTETPDTDATIDARLDARAAEAATATAGFIATQTASAPTPTDTPVLTDTPAPTATPLPTNTPIPLPPTNTPVPVTPTPIPTPTPDVPPIRGRIAVPVDNGLGGFNINLYTVPEGQLIGKIENAHHPSFRADGAKLLVNGEGGGRDNVWEINAGSLQFEKAVSSSPTDFHPFYNIDGSRLVIGNPNLAIGSDGSNHPFIFVQCGVRNPQEEGDHTCSDIARFGILVPSGQIGEIHGSNPVWTGNDLIVYKGCNTWQGGNSCGIFRVGSWANKRSSNGETPAKLSGIDGTETFPTDAQGTSVLYHDHKNDNWDVYLTDVAGGPVDLSNDPNANDALGTFSPDGQWVAFVSDKGGAWSIWVIPTIGGTAARLFDIPWTLPPQDWLNERISWGQ